tara:strand:+ start:8223 stop:8810 length:588 start_codon:yes stop_codon:yes gene_type:complete
VSTTLKISILLNIILGIIIYFTFGRCKQSLPIVTYVNRVIEVPAKSGILPVILNPPEIKTEVRIINKDLLKEYIAKQDSASKTEIFKEAITEREYNLNFKDSLVNIDIYAKTEGVLLEIKPSYTIYPSKVITKDKIITLPSKPKNSILAGVETSLPTDVYPYIKTSIYFQNKKSNIITIGVDTNRSIWFGYIVKL